MRSRFRRLRVLNLFFLLLFLSNCSPKVEPPVAKAIPKDVSLHGVTRIDDYFWLRERDNPEVIAYLEAENQYTDAVMAHTKILQEKLYNEMVARIKETDLDVPEKLGDYFYYQRTEQGKQYPIHCRKRGDFGASEEIILDENQLAAGREYLKSAYSKSAPNQELLAFSVDTTGAMHPDVIPNNEYSLEWANDNQTFFYNTVDDARRPYRVFRHTLGTPPEHDVLIYHEPDEMYFLAIDKSRSPAYLFLELESTSTTEVWYRDADRPQENFTVVHPRHQMEYAVQHHGNQFYIVTNDDAVNFKVVSAPVNNPSKKNWRDVIPHRESVKIDGIQPFENHLVVYERENGLRKIRITDLENQKTHYVTFEEPAYAVRVRENPEFKTESLRFGYTSLVTPESVF